MVLTIINNFTQYRINDFYNKRYYEGGFHLYQVQLMLEYVENKKYNEYRFFAAISGVDLDKEVGKDKKQSLDDQQKKQDLPIFKDPDEYNDLDEEEKQKMTENMMKQHKNWANKNKPNSSGV